MKNLFSALALLVLAGSVAIAQQGVLPKMAGYPHDLRSNGAKAATTAGASDKLCSYCHSPHIPTTGIPTPLWARKAAASKGWGVYSSSTMDATVIDPSDPTGDQNKNESNMCLSCHDGSAMYTTSQYEKRPYVSPSSAWTAVENRTVGAAQNLISGNYNGLSHTHPVNFDYDAAQLADPGLYPKVNAKYVYLDGTTKVGRLFNGKMQCSSCHNPHNSSKMIQGTTADSKLCVACHNK